jgi:hypothetical protein
MHPGCNEKVVGPSAKVTGKEKPAHRGNDFVILG